MFEQFGDAAEILSVNDGYYRLMESSPELLFRSGQLITDWLEERDRPAFLMAMDVASETGERQELVIRRYMDSYRIKSLMVSVYYMGRKDSRKLFLALFRDISELRLPAEFDGRRLSAVPSEETGPPQPSQKLGCRTCPKLLIVEDNRVNQLVLEKILSPQYSILGASNGKAGLDALRSGEDIRVVLLDIIMPIMDGYEFLQKKAQDPALRDIPVLVLSQRDNLDSEEKALRLGARGFVRKPYDPEDLRKTLDALANGT